MRGNTAATSQRAELAFTARARRAAARLPGCKCRTPVEPRPSDLSGAFTHRMKRHPWPHPVKTTREMDDLVDAYLDGKGNNYHVKLSEWMGDIEQRVVQPRTRTPDLAWLQLPGAGAILADRWFERLSEFTEDSVCDEDNQTLSWQKGLGFVMIDGQLIL